MAIWMSFFWDRALPGSIPVVVEIQTRYTVIGLRFLRLLLDGDRLALIVKFYDTEALRIIDIVAEYSRALFLGRSSTQAFHKSLTLENIVAQNHRYT